MIIVINIKFFQINVKKSFGTWVFCWIFSNFVPQYQCVMRNK